MEATPASGFGSRSRAERISSALITVGQALSSAGDDQLADELGQGRREDVEDERPPGVVVSRFS